MPSLPSLLFLAAFVCVSVTSLPTRATLPPPRIETADEPPLVCAQPMQQFGSAPSRRLCARARTHVCFVCRVRFWEAARRSVLTDTCHPIISSRPPLVPVLLRRKKEALLK